MCVLARLMKVPKNQIYQYRGTVKEIMKEIVKDIMKETMKEIMKKSTHPQKFRSPHQAFLDLAHVIISYKTLWRTSSNCSAAAVSL